MAGKGKFSRSGRLDCDFWNIGGKGGTSGVVFELEDVYDENEEELLCWECEDAAFELLNGELWFW